MENCPIIDVTSDATAAAITLRLEQETSPLVCLVFEAEAAQPFTADDAALACTLANLPATGRLAVGFTAGHVRGRALALLLHCSLPMFGPTARLSAGFGEPAAAAIYAAAASRIGALACERHLFAGQAMDIDQIRSCELGGVASTAEEALAQAQSRFATMLAVHRANLITWPFPIDVARALVDPA